MQIAAKVQIGRVTAVEQLLLNHLLLICLGLERLGHVIMEDPHTGLLRTIKTGLADPIMYRARVQWLLGRQAALAFTGQLVALQLAELPLIRFL